MSTIQANSVDQYADVKILDASDGTEKTDVTDATAGLAIRYQIDNGSVGSLTPAAMTAGGAHAAGGIVHIGGGNYKIGLSDAMLTAASTIKVWTELAGASSIPDIVQVVGYDPDDGGRIGMSDFADVDTLTVAESLRVITAVLLGKLSGADTNTLVYRDIEDTKDRVTATTGLTGRITIVYDATP